MHARRHKTENTFARAFSKFDVLSANTGCSLQPQIKSSAEGDNVYAVWEDNHIFGNTGQ